MTAEEIRDKYIFKPTKEMLMIAECFEKNLHNYEYWKSFFKLFIYHRDEYLTESEEWKKGGEHYGEIVNPDYNYINLYGSDMRSYLESKEEALREMDLCIDKVRKSDPNFFILYHVYYIEKRSDYKVKGLYNNKLVIAGENSMVSSKGEVLKLILKMYTDGEIGDLELDTAEDMIGFVDFTLKNYTIAVLYSNNQRTESSGRIINQEFVKIFV